MLVMLAMLSSMLALLIAFVVMCCLMGLISSYVSGWQKLATQFKATQKPYGKAFSTLFQYILIGSMPFSNLKLYINQEGLFVTMTFFLRCGNPDLFILWHEMHELSRENGFWGTSSRVTFAIGDPELGRMTLPSKVFDDWSITA